MTALSRISAFRRTLSPGALVLRSLALILLLSALPGAPVQAQDTSEKKPLPMADYRLWRSISGATISPDGMWAGWSYSRERGDDTLHIVNLDSHQEHLVPLASEPVFSDDGRWVAFFISPSFSEAEKLRKKDEVVTRKAGLLKLDSGEQFTWEDAVAVTFSRGSTHLAVKKRRADPKADFQGSDLILRKLAGGYDELLGSVDEFGFNKPGTLFAYTVDAADKDGNGLYLADLRTGARRVLDDAKARYGKLSWAEEGEGLAVLRGEIPEGKVHRANALVAFTEFEGTNPRRFLFEAESNQGLPAGHVISEDGNIQWSEGLETLFVGTRAQEDKLEDWPDDALPLADVNIWHWADEVIQPAQQRRAARDRERSYTAAVHMDSGRMVSLADTLMPSVEITRDGRWGLGQDPTPYISDWQPPYADLYRVDTRTGQRTPILTKQLRTLGLSPDSRHFLYWKDGDVWLYTLADDAHRNLTDSAPVDFTDMEFDRFGERPPYGVAGWTRDGRGVLLYHRYDVWLQPLDGSPARNITGGRGARDEIQLRYLRTDPEERAIDMSEPLLLSAYGEWTKKEGFFELRGESLRELTWEDRKFSRPQKAEKADRYLFTVQSWEEFPDIWVSGRDFTDRTRVTVANPQQDEYRWGQRILFDYTNADGVPLQGTLAIPDGYEAGQKLPMIVRFYEKYSQDLHVYPMPMYRHQPNFAGYVSNGYLLMMPDIHFRIGSSHSDMLECVEAAVRKVIELGYADPAAVGLSGHSYSGGGGAYIATRSRMFAAVAHGAAPINLVSEFNQLFVGSGQNNHQYDIYGQGRYGTNPFDDFQLYWDQSPISGVEEMSTPVLYLHGEADPTVNFEQGWEWYNALRFLGKPIIFLSYPGEGHGLSRLENKIDFQYRLREFFDHHLKGTPAPAWMTEGVRFLQKDRALREYAPKVFVTPPDTAPPTAHPSPPPEPPVAWLPVMGEYAADGDTLSLLERDGALFLHPWSGDFRALTAAENEAFITAEGDTLRLLRDGGAGASVEGLAFAGSTYPRLRLGGEEGETFTITPLRSPAELREEALLATPPEEEGDFLPSDLVELVKLDSTIRLDIRYASTNNFMREVFYSSPRAFLQRPAAEGVVRANAWLKDRGFGLLIHDGYRPWYVTKMFWDATPEPLREFVADPASGSRHNRGCAVDLTLFDLETGEPVVMPGGFDEMSPRSYADYPGGTARQRWLRELLREAMEAQGFTVYPGEWWHFDYQDWRRYRIQNLRFEEIATG